MKILYKTKLLNLKILFLLAKKSIKLSMNYLNSSLLAELTTSFSTHKNFLRTTKNYFYTS